MTIMAYLKIGLCLALLAGGFGSAWYIRGQTIDKLKLGAQVCQEANTEQDKTIKALQDGIVKADKSCQERLSSKDHAIKKLREIDALRGYDEKNPASGNPLRDALNRMFDNDKDAVR